MMPVADSAPYEGTDIRVLAAGIEHPRRLAILGHSLPTEIAEMSAQRPHAGPVTNDPRLDDNPTAPLIEKSSIGSPRCDAAPADRMLGRSCRAASGDA
jgi:hypothetical protein